MELVPMLIVGLVAGLLASAAMHGSGYGLLGDLAIGIAGAVIGSWLFAGLGWATPFAGIAGTITVAFVGAVVLLAALRLIRAVAARHAPGA